jgi:hypothetical protein
MSIAFGEIISRSAAKLLSKDAANRGEYRQAAGVYPQVGRIAVIFVIAGVRWCANHLAGRQSQTRGNIPTSSSLSSIKIYWMSK